MADNMNVEHFLRYETHRRDAYKVLSTCYHLPTADNLARLSALEAALEKVCPDVAGLVATMKDAADIEPLTVDYAKLFMGPYQVPAPPYGSIYLEGKREVMGQSTINALNQYQAAGLSITGRVKEAPDHIAIELEFMYYLIFKTLESIRLSDLNKAGFYLERQKQFLDSHLGVWVAEFSDIVATNAATSFYSNLARATSIFVRKDCSYTSKVQLPQLENSIIDP